MIKDFNGYEINKRPSIKLNQYRELFVQEIFTKRGLPIDKNFVDKSLPLSKSLINSINLNDELDYLVNLVLFFMLRCYYF